MLFQVRGMYPHPCSSIHHALCMQVILHLATRLEALHALGYVHRDLKPANVMWLPRQNRWTVIDFGCAARIGAAARIAFSVAYAAPEVICALRTGQATMIAHESLDVWSLGVMAFELLTGEPVFKMLHGKEKARTPNFLHDALHNALHSLVVHCGGCLHSVCMDAPWDVLRPVKWHFAQCCRVALCAICVRRACLHLMQATCR
jgi:serine/threonine protein kinase